MKKSIGSQMKKLLSAFLAAAILVCAAPVSFAANAEDTAFSVGDIIEFGTYPQSEVTDSATVSALNSTEKTWKSYEYYINQVQSDFMQYTDVSYNGAKYRGVKFSQYRPEYTSSYSSTGTTYQDDNGYYTNTTYWFEYEPLKWRVLDPNEGLVVCENIIDSQDYYHNVREIRTINGKTIYPNNYAYSDIRSWLTSESDQTSFYNTAFDSSQKGQISERTHDNSGPWTSKYNSENTTDKVFLLSHDEVINSNYGFSSSSSDCDINRRAHSTDYAKCQGTYVYTGSDYQTADGEDASWWWLRSPGNLSDNACYVYNFGFADNYDSVDYANLGVRPALKISNLSFLLPKTVTVTFDANGGIAEFASKTVESGSVVGTLPVTIREGCTFSGWYTADGERVTEETVVTDNAVYYARWAKIPSVVHSVSVQDSLEINYKSSSVISVNIAADAGANYTVKWSSSDPKTAKVDENGKVTAAKKGSATITCTVTDELGNTVTDTCKVTVNYVWWQWIIIILLFGWIWY